MNAALSRYHQCHELINRERVFYMELMELFVGLSQGSFSHLRLQGESRRCFPMYYDSSPSNFLLTIHNFIERERERERERENVCPWNNDTICLHCEETSQRNTKDLWGWQTGGDYKELAANPFIISVPRVSSTLETINLGWSVFHHINVYISLPGTNIFYMYFGIYDLCLYICVIMVIPIVM